MNLDNLWLFYSSIFFILLSLIFLHRKQTNTAVFFLFAGAFILRLFAAYLDPFLHNWDERFHALVARNMMADPFTPMLKPGLFIPYNYKAWCCNEVWLHKQPLFLWQMALSMKIFGVSEFSLRYPSVLMGALMVPILYRISYITTKNRLVSYGAALFMCVSGYQLQLVSGYKGMEHNDVAFGFYILASIWAYAEYTNKRTIKWALLIGLFAGLAILNKWMTGLLVFSGWGINILFNTKNKDIRKEVIHLFTALGVCAIVFLPWQIYILLRFPAEATYEYSLNSRHIFEVVEGHSGHNEYYLNKFPEYFGRYAWMAVFAGALIIAFRSGFTRQLRIALLTYISVVYVFFSLIVATKLESFFYIVVPIGFIFTSVAVWQFSRLIKFGTAVNYVLLAVCSFSILDTHSLQGHHNPDDQYRQNKIYNTYIYKNLHRLVPRDIRIILNLSDFNDIDLMFYQKKYIAFQYCLNEEDFKLIEDRDERVGIITSNGAGVPAYALEYPGTYMIRIQLRPTNE